MEFELTTRCLSVTVGGSVGECGRLSQLSWFLGALVYSYTYLLTYVLSGVLLNALLAYVQWHRRAQLKVGIIL